MITLFHPNGTKIESSTDWTLPKRKEHLKDGRSAQEIINAWIMQHGLTLASLDNHFAQVAGLNMVSGIMEAQR